jgi:hypothetical protein
LLSLPRRGRRHARQTRTRRALHPPAEGARCSPGVHRPEEGYQAPSATRNPVARPRTTLSAQKITSSRTGWISKLKDGTTLVDAMLGRARPTAAVGGLLRREGGGRRRAVSSGACLRMGLTNRASLFGAAKRRRTSAANPATRNAVRASTGGRGGARRGPCSADFPLTPTRGNPVGRSSVAGSRADRGADAPSTRSQTPRRSPASVNAPSGRAATAQMTRRALSMLDLLLQDDSAARSARASCAKGQLRSIR